MISDGHHWFKWLGAKGELPGKYSLIRIYPSEKNRLFTIPINHTQVRKCIHLGSGCFTKILDGEHTRGRIGEPTPLEGCTKPDCNGVIDEYYGVNHCSICNVEEVD